MTALAQVVGRSIILAWREDVGQLSDALTEEGLHPEVQRASYTDEQLTFARATRLFLNHRDAWIRAAESNDYTLICESDFVPCVGLGSLRTFWPLENQLAWGYLYQGSPRILAAVGDRPYLRGHNATAVAYVINAAVAQILLRFYDCEMAQYDPHDYFAWDAHLQWFAMGRGAEAYIPLRHYGEHGGFPNPEHAKFGATGVVVHRADNLAAPLKFLPQYACGSRVRYFIVRTIAHLLGWARLLAGRWIIPTNVYDLSSTSRLKLYGIGIRRRIGF
jgi:hypothetical protein